MTPPITKNMTFHQVMRLNPDVLKVLARFQLGCAGCMGAQQETLEKGALAHGLDIDELLEELNAVCKE
jgi:hybrid cluster-associated redox disulfide protein